MTDRTRTAPRRYRLLRRLVLVGVGCVYAVVFAEIFLRIMDPQPLMPRYITGTDRGIRGNIPNAVYRQTTPEISVEMRINGQGLRAERDFTREKPPGTCRIALMGDSYFLGYEVRYEDALAQVLGRLLTEQGYRVEVLNFAVSGFSTEEMLREFETRARHFDPDIIVYQFNAGDFNDNMRPGLYRLDADGRPQPTEASYLPGVAVRDKLMRFGLYRWLIGNSHFYSAIREWAGETVKKLLAWRGALTAAKAEPAKPAPASEGPKRRHPVFKTRYTSALLELARERAEAEGVDWYALEIPTPIWRDYLSDIGELSLSPETSARLISPVPAFETRKPGDPWLYRERGHAHLTELGNQLAAEALLDGILADSAARLARCQS